MAIYGIGLQSPDLAGQVPLTRKGQRVLDNSQNGSSSNPYIPPGKQATTQQIHLNWLFDMSILGKYTLCVTNTQLGARSNELEIEVKLDGSLIQPLPPQLP